jgi:cellulose synthase/poly-beta-1,6-N-acetylglucosamine synthase-like glycosyltransferase
VTGVASALALADIAGVLATRLAGDGGPHPAKQIAFLAIVASLVYGGCAFLLARLGHLCRLQRHRPASDQELGAVFGRRDAELVTILVPSYREDPRVVRRALWSAALQEYPKRRVVLLIDDPPHPASVADAALLRAARGVPGSIEALLAAPRRLCATAREGFLARRAAGGLDPAGERAELARLHEEVGAWFEEQAASYESLDHADRFFVEVALRDPARSCRARAAELRRPSAPGRPAAPFAAAELAVEYERLLARFRVEVTSFERKRYANLPHEANKAMNLNAYIALLGSDLREAQREGSLHLEPTDGRRADLRVPDSEYLLILDADSVVLPEYALRLIRCLGQPGHERTAVVQTPYSAFPGAPGTLERVAGATTDVQYVAHQGLSRYGGTYWVGANAVVRTAALREIAVRSTERGHEVTRFVQDRTVIEDTESTVDLLLHGWQLHNYPERLAYSETPPDFGSLLIQRRRWANGGLLILPKLLRHVARNWARPGTWPQAFVMVQYLTSLATANLGLQVLICFSFEDSLRSWWLPLTALPYYALYARELVQAGYPLADVLRVYALNLVLIPVHLVGVFASLRQAVTGRKAAFGRTPKVLGRTRVPRAYLAVELGLLAQWLVFAAYDLYLSLPLHAALTLVNSAFLAWGLATFLGPPQIAQDLFASFSRRPAEAT